MQGYLGRIARIVPIVSALYLPVASAELGAIPSSGTPVVNREGHVPLHLYSG